MLVRTSVKREDREELARKVSLSKALKKQPESEKERWKRLAKERGHCKAAIVVVLVVVVLVVVGS
jgi:hypothetical protein